MTLKIVGQSNLVNPFAIWDRLQPATQTSDHRLPRTLRMLAAVATVYDDLPDTTIDVGILNRSLIDRLWARNIFPSEQFTRGWSPALEQSNRFAIISYFESGIHDVDSTQLKNVIALSSTNSLFVCRPVSTHCVLVVSIPLTFISYLKTHTRPCSNPGASVEFSVTSANQVSRSCCRHKNP